MDEVLASDGENVVMSTSVVTDEGIVAASAFEKLETADEESEEDQ